MNMVNTIGIILDLWGIFSLFVVAFLVFRGLLPALWRLGNGLSRKTIAIYAKGDKADELKKLVNDLSIFKGKIISIKSKNEFGDIENAHIHLVRWCDFKNNLNDILQKKRKNDALIIYCPHEDGRIDDELSLINSKENSLIVQFRGRLLNDIVTSLITTGYEKK